MPSSFIFRNGNTAQAILYLTYETYRYILQVIFYQHLEMGLVCVKVHGISLSRYNVYHTLHPTPPSSLAILQKELKITSHFPVARSGGGGGLSPSLALEALNAPDHSPLKLLLASQMRHTHGFHPT